MSANLIYVFLSNNFNNKKLQRVDSNSSSDIPSYYIDTFKFNSKKFKNSYVITNRDIIAKYANVFPEGTHFISVEDEICNTEEFKTVQSLLELTWSELYTTDAFWYVTFMRIIVLSIFIKQKNLSNVIHVEADNLIFETDFKNIFELLAVGEFSYTNEAAYASAPCTIIFKDGLAGSNMLNHHISLLKKGEHIIKHHVGHFYNWIADMAFLDLIHRAKKNYKMLPCLPFGPYAENFNTLKLIFDPISYGQFLGGTNNKCDPGYAERRHFVGKEICDGTVKVTFNKRPFIEYKNELIPLFNLHLHNKGSIPLFIS